MSLCPPPLSLEGRIQCELIYKYMRECPSNGLVGYEVEPFVGEWIVARRCEGVYVCVSVCVCVGVCLWGRGGCV